MKRIVEKTVLSLCLFLSVACSKGEKEQEQDSSLTVETSTVVSMAESPDQLFPFISRPYRSTDLSFRVGGLVKDLDVHAGNFYRRGSVIAVIDPRDFEIRCSRAKALFEQAEVEYRRVEALYRLNNISASAYEKAKADRATTEAAYQMARNELSDTRLTAPFDGYVQEVYFERYQEVRSGQPILSFVEIDRLKIEVYVPQSVALTVRKGESLSLCFDAQPERRYSASVVDVSKGTTANNLSFLVTALLANDDRTLPAGMSGKAMIRMEQASLPARLLVPQKALRHRPKYGAFVWVLNEEKGEAEYRSVEVGKLHREGLIEVLRGVKAGERVVTTGLESVSEKQRVSVRNGK